jgi:Heterokaryon incompatibility protein (HET)
MASSQLYASCPVDKSTAQIRLIHLQPLLGLDQEDIRCTLHLANLEDESTRYKALSYEWGPESETVGEFSITFDGEEVPVRENLYQALQYIRSETGEIKLWVDALCINQGNQEERNHQVRSPFLSRKNPSCCSAPHSGLNVPICSAKSC